MIDRELVHRTVEREVFVIEGTPLDERSILVEVCIPGVHARVRRAGSQVPTIVMLEVFRQGAFLAAHQLGRIPADWRFAAHALSAVWSSSAPVVPALGAIWCELHVTVGLRALHAEEIAIEWQFDLTEEQQPVAHGSATATARSPHRHEQRLTDPPAEDDGAGDRLEIGGIGHSDPIVWDARDPFLADTVQEEVSSLVFADAVLSHSATPPHPTGFEMELLAPAAHGRPLHLHRSPREESVEFLVLQDRVPIASSRVHFEALH